MSWGPNALSIVLIVLLSCELFVVGTNSLQSWHGKKSIDWFSSVFRAYFENFFSKNSVAFSFSSNLNNFVIISPQSIPSQSRDNLQLFRTLFELLLSAEQISNFTVDCKKVGFRLVCLGTNGTIFRLIINRILFGSLSKVLALKTNQNCLRFCVRIYWLRRDNQLPSGQLFAKEGVHPL